MSGGGGYKLCVWCLELLPGGRGEQGPSGAGALASAAGRRAEKSRGRTARHSETSGDRG